MLCLCSLNDWAVMNPYAKIAALVLKEFGSMQGLLCQPLFAVLRTGVQGTSMS